VNCEAKSELLVGVGIFVSVASVSTVSMELEIWVWEGPYGREVIFFIKQPLT